MFLCSFVRKSKFRSLIWDIKSTFAPRIKYLRAWLQKSGEHTVVMIELLLLKLYSSLVRSKSSLVESLYNEASDHSLRFRRKMVALKANPRKPAYNVVFYLRH